jgi:Ca-activated chloride channel family protein
LLTAYTSFVAVDTRVRSKDGQVITVKQPLPLPQGVSDYAVGNTSMDRKMGSGILAVPTALHRESRIKERGMSAGKLEHHVAQDSVAETEVSTSQLGLEKIRVTGKLSQPSVKKRLEKQLSQMAACYRVLPEKGRFLDGRVVFEMIIDSSGAVVDLKRVDKGKKYRDLAQCILKHLRNLRFPVPKDGKGVLITVSFVVK